MQTEKIKERISHLLFVNNISEKTLAESINLSPQALHYLLHNSQTLDIAIYDDIKEFFRKRNIALHENEDVIKKFSQYSLEFNSMLNQMLFTLNKILSDYLKGKTIGDYEKEQLLNQIDSFSGNIKQAINSIKITLENQND